DRQRSHFGDVRAERRQFGAADDLPRPHRDHEAIGANAQLAERPRQKMSFLEVRLDQRVQLLRVGGLSRAQSHPCLPHAAAPAAPSAASRRASASSTSGSVMTSGGSRRTTVSAVRLTTTPRSRPARPTPAPSPPPPSP